jgi:hypothetical protein
MTALQSKTILFSLLIITVGIVAVAAICKGWSEVAVGSVVVAILGAVGTFWGRLKATKRIGGGPLALLLACLLLCVGCADQGKRDPFYLGVKATWTDGGLGQDYRRMLAADPTLTENDKAARAWVADKLDQHIAEKGSR